MSDVHGIVFGLRLRPEDHLVDEVGDGECLCSLENAIERGGLQRCVARELHVEAVEEVPQVLELLCAGLVVHAIDEGRALGFERLRGRHVGLDHELLDEPVRGEALRHDDATRPSSSRRILRSGRSRSSG